MTQTYVILVMLSLHTSFGKRLVLSLVTLSLIDVYIAGISVSTVRQCIAVGMCDPHYWV